MSKSTLFKRTVERIIDKKNTPKPQTGVVHSLDGNKANIRIGNSPSLIRAVAIIGDPLLVKVGDEVQLAWTNERPVILAGGASEVPNATNVQVVVDNSTIERSASGLRVKRGGIGRQHLNFSPALEGHTHKDSLTEGGWVVTENGVIFNNKTFISPDGTITLGQSPDIIRLSSEDASYRIWAGATIPDAAPFAVSKEGAIKATSGLIGGWTLGEAAITADGGNAELNAASPHIQLGGATYASGGGFWAGKDAGVYKLKIGDTAAFLDWNGSALTIQGDLRSSNFVPGLTGWGINLDGDAEFRNAIIRGAIKSSVIEYDQVAAVGGNLLLSKGAGMVRDDFTATSVNFYINLRIPDGVSHSDVGNHWAVDDVVRVKEGDVDFWGMVSAFTDNTACWTLEISRLDAAGDMFVRAGATLINYGPSGSGVIEMAAQSPLIKLFSHDGAPHSSITGLLFIGNLNGYFGFAVDKFGFGVGDPALTGDYFYATDEGVKMSGEINASAGQIGGWLIDANAIKSAASGARIVLDKQTYGGLMTYDGADTYDPSTGLGTYQVKLSLQDGKLYAGGGNVYLDEEGLHVLCAYAAYDAGSAILFDNVGLVSGSRSFSMGGPATQTLLLEAGSSSLGYGLLRGRIWDAFGSAWIDSFISTTSGFTIGQDAKVTGNLEVQGYIFDTTGKVTISDDLYLTGGLDIRGSIYNGGGTLTLNDNTQVNGDLTVSGATNHRLFIPHFPSWIGRGGTAVYGHSPDGVSLAIYKSGVGACETVIAVPQGWAGKTIKINVLWFTTATSGYPRIELRAYKYDDGDPGVPSFFYNALMYPSAPTTSGSIAKTTFSSLSIPADAEALMLKFIRWSTAGNDTLADTVYLLTAYAELQ